MFATACRLKSYLSGAYIPLLPVRVTVIKAYVRFHSVLIERKSNDKKQQKAGCPFGIPRKATVPLGFGEHFSLLLDQVFELDNMQHFFHREEKQFRFYRQLKTSRL